MYEFDKVISIKQILKRKIFRFSRLSTSDLPLIGERKLASMEAFPSIIFWIICKSKKKLRTRGKMDFFFFLRKNIIDSDPISKKFVTKYILIFGINNPSPILWSIYSTLAHSTLTYIFTNEIFNKIFKNFQFFIHFRTSL